jgi:AraC family transcriptional activator of pobA
MDEKTRFPVPKYGLYGEGFPVTDAEFVHIESVVSRSARYDWRIADHAHNGLFQAITIFAGGAEVRLDGVAHRVDGPAVVTVPPAAIHGFHFDPATDGQVLTVAERLLFSAAREGGEEVGSLTNLLLAAPRWLAFPAVDRLAVIFDALVSEFAAPGAGRALALDGLARAALVTIARHLAPAEVSDRPRWELFSRFRSLVEVHYLDHWPIPEYADALGMTETTLNRLCHAAAGRSAFAVVQERLLLEARRKLVYIALPVASIAYELGFNDPAYFSRFFRRHTGESPAVWRRRKSGEKAVA